MSRFRDLERRVADACRMDGHHESKLVRALTSRVAYGRDELPLPRAADYEADDGLDAMRVASMALAIRLRGAVAPHAAPVDRVALRERVAREFPRDEWSDAAIAKACELGRQVRAALFEPVAP
jgi:hypothetical protein